jgi:predicted ATPase
LLIEDLHWLDSETEAWVQQLSERVPTAPVLLLVNYRPEYQHAWGSKTYYTQLRLDPLGQAEADELLTALLGQDLGLTALKQLILARTEGNPFFKVEGSTGGKRSCIGSRGSCCCRGRWTTRRRRKSAFSRP